MLEILFLLLMLGMIGATLFVGLRERKARLVAAKSNAKSSAPSGQVMESAEEPDGFPGEAPEQFDFDPGEFKK